MEGRITKAICLSVKAQVLVNAASSGQIDDHSLEVIAKALGVTSEFIRNFNEEKVIYNIQNNNTYHDNSSGQQHYKPTIFNEAGNKIVELLEKFIQRDQEKTQSVAELSKAVLDLAEEVKRLKEKQG
ncbi:MAG: hypothetical protein AB2L24_12400 [Mangrovibacterium sp.]